MELLFVLLLDVGNDAVAAAESLKKSVNPAVFVVKAQIHAGGRGKAGGVKVCKTMDDVRAAANIMGKTLVTPQTDASGKKFINFGSKADATLKKNITLVLFLIAQNLQ